jgi:hypothetical protein
MRPKSQEKAYKRVLYEKVEQPLSTLKWDAFVERHKLEREQKKLSLERRLLDDHIRVQRQKDVESLFYNFI